MTLTCMAASNQMNKSDFCTDYAIKQYKNIFCHVSFCTTFISKAISTILPLILFPCFLWDYKEPIEITVSRSISVKEETWPAPFASYQKKKERKKTNLKWYWAVNNMHCSLSFLILLECNNDCETYIIVGSAKGSWVFKASKWRH